MVVGGLLLVVDQLFVASHLGLALMIKATESGGQLTTRTIANLGHWE